MFDRWQRRAIKLQNSLSRETVPSHGLLVILLPITAAALEALPGSYSNRYETAVREGLARYSEMPLVTEHDRIDLPAPVQKYLRVTGALGKPQIHNFRAVFTGDFRNGSESPWMVFRSEQYNFFDQPMSVGGLPRPSRPHPLTVGSGTR